MRKAVVLLAGVVLLSATVTAASGIYGVNGSEPGFLKDIGPQDERTDNAVAAVVVAVAVAAVILRGLQSHRGNET
ncbi:MAG: hypothetical protein SVY41_02110 [Candidatus Nanohaloarchaea archaeon]|nr:hypothetical protein [Candidatus Nanohaloarchaea archaeon]